jgi:hypothetical protein
MSAASRAVNRRSCSSGIVYLVVSVCFNGLLAPPRFIKNIGNRGEEICVHDYRQDYRRNLLFVRGLLASGFGRYLLLSFAKYIVGEVIWLELWQFAQCFTLFFTAWQII